MQSKSFRSWLYLSIAIFIISSNIFALDNKLNEQQTDYINRFIDHLNENKDAQTDLKIKIIDPELIKQKVQDFINQSPPSLIKKIESMSQDEQSLFAQVIVVNQIKLIEENKEAEETITSYYQDMHNNPSKNKVKIAIQEKKQTTKTPRFFKKGNSYFRCKGKTITLTNNEKILIKDFKCFKIIPPKCKKNTLTIKPGYDACTSKDPNTNTQIIKPINCISNHSISGTYSNNNIFIDLKNNKDFCYIKIGEEKYNCTNPRYNIYEKNKKLICYDPISKKEFSNFIFK